MAVLVGKMKLKLEGWKLEVILTLSNNDCLENFEMNEDANKRDYRWSDPNGFNKCIT